MTQPRQENRKPPRTAHYPAAVGRAAYPPKQEAAKLLKTKACSEIRWRILDTDNAIAESQEKSRDTWTVVDLSVETGPTFPCQAAARSPEMVMFALGYPQKKSKEQYTNTAGNKGRRTVVFSVYDISYFCAYPIGHDDKFDMTTLWVYCSIVPGRS